MMSRTLKDRHWKLQYPDFRWDYDTVKITSDSGRVIQYLKLPGVKPKKRKEVDSDWHWLRGSPGWWTRLTMNRPQRRAGHVWEQKVLLETDLEDTDPPSVSYKPHVYYY
jgi:hypothetical protein